MAKVKAASFVIVESADKVSLERSPAKFIVPPAKFKDDTISCCVIFVAAWFSNIRAPTVT